MEGILGIPGRISPEGSETKGPGTREFEETDSFGGHSTHMAAVCFQVDQQPTPAPRLETQDVSSAAGFRALGEEEGALLGQGYKPVPGVRQKLGRTG